MNNSTYKKNKDNKREKNGSNFSHRAVDITEKINDECIVAGRNAVRELLGTERDVEKIYVGCGEREGSIKLLVALAKERKIPVIELDRQKLDSISGGARHQGIVAIASERNYYSVDELLSYAEERGEKPFLVMLDGVEDPHNLGAIIRSAECLGVHGIIIPKRRSVGLTQTVAKASAGAVEYMKVARVTNLAVTIDELKEKGLWFYAADMGDTEYYKADMTGAACIVLGSEGFGISRLVREKCDFTVSIPLLGNVNSMNVSCAAAVILAEAARQRKEALGS